MLVAMDDVEIGWFEIIGIGGVGRGCLGGINFGHRMVMLVREIHFANGIFWMGCKCVEGNT